MKKTSSKTAISLSPHERGLAYAEGVVKGVIPAPAAVKQVADWLLDVIRTEELEFRPKNVDGRVRLIEKLDLPSGVKGNFELLPYQCFVMLLIYGLRRGGARAVKRLLLLLPRKAGKSSMMGGIAIGEMLRPVGGTENVEILCAGVNEETANHVFGKARQMLLKEQQKANGLYDQYEVKLATDYIHSKRSGGTIKRTSSGARSLEGWVASVIIFDEISQLKEPNAINILNSGLGHDPNRLLLCASTEGDLPESALDSERELCVNMLAAKKRDCAYIGLLYAAGIKDDWTAVETWERVQPRLRDPKGDLLEHYREQCELAMQDERIRDNFLLRQLNIPLGGGVGWLNAAELDAVPKLPRDWPPPNHARMKHFLGIDLGDSRDASVICLLSVDADDSWEHRYWIYYPDGQGLWVDDGDHQIATLYSGGIHKKYRQLAERGHATMCSGPVVNHQIIADQVKEIAKGVRLRGMYVDQYHGVEELRMALGEEWSGRLLPIPKSGETQSKAIRQAESKLKLNQMRMQDNPIVRDHFLNAVLRHYESGALRISKLTKTSLAHIDAADAFLHAVIGRSYVESKEAFVGKEIRPVDNEDDAGDLKPEDYLLSDEAEDEEFD